MQATIMSKQSMMKNAMAVSLLIGKFFEFSFLEVAIKSLQMNVFA
jgi:hypothetical protein